MTLRKRFLLTTIVVISTAGLPAPVMAQFRFNSFNDDSFDDLENWQPPLRVPGTGDIAIHDPAFDTGNGRLLMDAFSQFDDPHDVAEFNVEGSWTIGDPGNLTFRQYCNFWTPEYNDCGPDDPSALNVQNGMNSAVLNGYEIRVGPNDEMLVGDPLELGFPNPTASTMGFAWDLLGWARTQPAWVAVTGTIGPGTWSVQKAQIRVGVEKAGFDFDNAPIIGDGVIDSDVVNTGAGNSIWTIDGLDLVARRCQNLDSWVITADNNHGTRIRALEYFEVGSMWFSGAFHSSICEYDTLSARMPAGLPLPDDEVGLHIKGSLFMTPHRGHVEVDHGPILDVWSLNLRPQAALTITGSKAFVWKGGAESDGFARFQDGSKLLYGGTSSGTREPCLLSSSWICRTGRGATTL